MFRLFIGSSKMRKSGHSIEVSEDSVKGFERITSQLILERWRKAAEMRSCSCFLEFRNKRAASDLPWHGRKKRWEKKRRGMEKPRHVLQTHGASSKVAPHLPVL